MNKTIARVTFIHPNNLFESGAVSLLGTSVSIRLEWVRTADLGGGPGVSLSAGWGIETDI
jgi:hypothetical protein